MRAVFTFISWIIGVGLAGVVLAVLIFNACVQLRLRNHRGLTRNEFVTYFVKNGANPELVGPIYDYYRSYAIWRRFTIAPTDAIETLLHIDSEFFEEDFIAILDRVGLQMPPDEAWDRWSGQPVKTIEDMVKAVEWASRNQPFG